MLDLEKYVTVADIFEADDTTMSKLDLDELWVTGKVRGFGIRLNDMNGGHHKDELFDYHWKRIGDYISPDKHRFARFPYFVYNPWVSGVENFYWERAHFPKDSLIAGDDVEVIRNISQPDGSQALYSKKEYADNVNIFTGMNKGLTQLMYTGPWFIPYLEYWPTNKLYWWAQYFDVMHTTIGKISWEEFYKRAAQLSWPHNAPGRVAVYQITADRLILPGCGGRKIDWNLISREDFDMFWPPDTLLVKDDLPYHTDIPLVQGGANTSTTPPAPVNAPTSAGIKYLIQVGPRYIYDNSALRGMAIGKVSRGDTVTIIAKTGYAGQLSTRGWIDISSGVLPLQ